MALRVVTMTELRLEVLLEPQRTGESVAEVCRRREISRHSYYRFKRRYQAEGPEGLEARSRRPLGSPWQIDVDLEVEICRMRKDHPRWGARRIRAELRRSGVEPPAVSTIHRVLRRNHLVADQPRKRPKATKRSTSSSPGVAQRACGLVVPGSQEEGRPRPRPRGPSAERGARCARPSGEGSLPPHPPAAL